MASTTIRVLVVDDDPKICRAFVRCLQGEAIDVDVAHSGAQAWQMVQHRHYPVIVTDLRMPGMDGWTLVKKLQAAGIPSSIIVLTGLPEVDLPQQANAPARIVSILTKPFDRDEILNAIRGAEESSAIAASNADAVETSLLLVEDNPVDVALVSRHLRRGGTYALRHCTRLDAAVSALQEEPAEVILTDLSLPDARGLDCVRRLQRVAPESTLIVLSGSSDERLALQAVQLGAQDYLVKGEVTTESLRRAVRYATERKRTERRLAHMAHFDQLTGLANRVTLKDRLIRGIDRAQQRSTNLSVMFLDLDRFKQINDTLGHDAGDALLQQAASRVQDCVRKYDTVARLGGDEFAILLEDAEDTAMAEDVANRVIESLGRPFRLGSSQAVVTGSIGIAHYPDGGHNGEELLKHADMAMYEAKEAGRNLYAVYQTKDRVSTIPRLEVENELRLALSADRFLLHYQPQWDLNHECVRGAEALLRLTRPDGTVLAPSQFLNVLEDSDLIIEAGAWALKTACLEAATWQHVGRPTRIAVNLSARQFMRPGLLEAVGDALSASGLAPHLLELEITESLLMRDTDATNETLEALKRMGVMIAIDDFGTGFSSLSYLDRFQVDVLKIDRSFVDAIARSGPGSSIADAVVGLGHKLELEVIAEGIETEEQLTFLQRVGCDTGQGFLLGRPAADWKPTGRTWSGKSRANPMLASPPLPAP